MKFGDTKIVSKFSTASGLEQL